jgi:hypothetical protein
VNFIKWLRDWMRAIVGGYKIWRKERKRIFRERVWTLYQRIEEGLLFVFYMGILFIIGYVVYKLALLIIRI